VTTSRGNEKATIKIVFSVRSPCRGKVQIVQSGSQGAWRQDELIGGKLPVVK
jgi:hypothetical protein